MNVLTAVLWGPHVLALILLCGIGFTVKSRFAQVTRLPRLVGGALKGSGAGGVSAFQALSASLAGSLGTGNIIGVAAAVAVGGPGALVWMCIAAFFGMMTVYAEGFLAAKYRKAGESGAISYVKKALGTPVAKLYAAGVVLSALGMGTMAQTGAISASLSAVHVPPAAAGILTAGLLILAVRRGLSGAVRITERLVPFMAALFLSACLAVLFLRASAIPAALLKMLGGAFDLRAGLGGVSGALLTGISRGVFTNEAGLGSGTFALCHAEGKTPEQIGTLGALQVFIDTIFLCTITGVCLLISPGTGSGGAYTLSSFSASLGGWGTAAVSVSMALFAFATVVAWSCYGMEALSYLVPAGGVWTTRLFVAAAAAACFLGCVTPFQRVLLLCDSMNGVMALPNLLALFRLSREVFPKSAKN